MLRTIYFRRLKLPGFIACLLLILSLSLPFSDSLTAQDSDSTAPLQVVDTVPLSGEELGLNEAVTFYFDRELDCSTALAAASVAPAEEGEFTCEDSSLTFTPDAGYARATDYTFTLADTLSAADGGTLAAAYTLELRTLGYLEVGTTLPVTGSEQVATDTPLTVIFNRPVVPLTTLGEMEDNPDPLSISPAIEGTGEWLNTSIYTFTPDVAWAGGTEYVITVDGDLTAVDGAPMSAPHMFAFTTVLPAVIESIPTNDPDGTITKVRLDASLQIRFNQPIDQDSFEDNFFITVGGAAPLPIDGEFTWTEDGQGVRYKPASNFELGTQYSYGVPEGVVFDVSGNATLPYYEAFFVTVPEPAITGTYPGDGEFGRPYGGIEIYFASEMNPETLADKITISPEPTGDVDYFYRTWNTSYAVTFGPEPSTTYTVNIAPGMEDIYGNTIDTPYSFTYTTQAYDPEVRLMVPSGAVGFYDAGREATEVYVTHRNVEQLEIDLYAVDLNNFISRLNSERYYSLLQEYTPVTGSQVNRWLIPNVAPENVLRYERLNLGEEPTTTTIAGEPFSCPGAMPSRAKVGDRAIVTADPNLRARSSAPDGEIVELLYVDYAFPIVGGPVCANSIVWWEIQLREGGNAWVAEGLADEYFFEVTDPAAETVVTLTDATESGKLVPGVYYLNVSSPEYRAAGYSDLKHFMVVGNVNLTMKAALDEVFVWATDIRTGAPLPNLPVTVYVFGYDPITANTDSEGMATFEITRRLDVYQPVTAVVNDGSRFGMSYTEWADGIDPWYFNVTYTYYPQRYQIYAYTERNVYRPGQTVYIRGIIRERDDMRYNVPDMETVPIEIFNDQGTTVYSDSLPINEYGSFNAEFELAEDAALGYYRINITMPTDSRNVYEGGGTSFNVAEYRIPEFQVTVTPQNDEVLQGETVRVEVDTRFFFGGPVVGAEINYGVNTRDYFFNYEGQGRYDFWNFDRDTGEFVPGPGYDSFFGEQVTSGSAVSDENGKFIIEVPAMLEEFNQSQLFTVEATVTDSTGQAVSGRAEVVVHLAEIYAGVTPSTYVGTAGQPASFDIITVDWDSEAVSDQTVNISVVERRWSSVQELDQDTGRITYDYTVEEIPVADGTVTTDADGQATFEFVPPNGGVYKATVTTTDSEGNEAIASSSMWVSSVDFVAWRIPNDNRIDLVADSSNYDVGDTAEILIMSPFMGTAEALITVEREDVITAERVTLDSNSYVHEIPITDDFIPNAVVSVFIVKGVDENNPVASFRMGMINLNVDNAPRELQIVIETDREFVGPRDTVTYTVQTTDFEGNPVQAEVGLSLVDLAVLSLGAPDVQPILQFFYGLQGLTVRTGSVLTINTDLITQFTLDVIKGGGGGGGGGFGIFEVRENFVDTPYWNPTFETDENGVGTFEVTLPDNLTTWRLTAHGITNPDDGRMLVGETTLDIVATKPVLVRPVTPRFFVVDDQVQMGAVVNNNTDSDLMVEITLEADGLSFAGDVTQTVSVPANGSTRVDWDVTVEDVDNVAMIFTANANNGEYTDATRPQVGQGDERLIPVYKYEAPETVGTGGTLREAGERLEVIALPRQFNVTQGELTVNLQTSLAATTIEGLDYLENYRYQSTSLTIDRLLANAATKQALTQLNVDDNALSSQLDREVNIALQRLAAEQKPGGGWGWYVNSEPDALVTAYAVIAILEASEAGYSVSPEMLVDGIAYLRGNVPTQESVARKFGVTDNSTYLNRRMIVFYALAKAGSPDVAALSNLYENRELLSNYAKALLALSLDASDERVTVLLNDLYASAVVSANGMHWEENIIDRINWTTDTRTTAIILNALVELDPDNELLPNAIRWLIVARDADAWETTHETAWSVLSLTKWMVETGELDAAYTYSADLNGEDLFEGQAARETGTETQKLVVEVAELLQDEANRLTLNRSAGDGALYYTAYLRAFLPVPEIPAVDRGVVVQRYYTLNGSDEPITEAQIGDLVDVHLTIIAPNSLNYLVVDDPLPAGAEGIDPSLATSQQAGTDPGVESTSLTEENDMRYGFGWWFFDDIDFRDERVVLSATYLPAGTYEYVYSMRPSVAGTFNVIPPVAQEFFFPEVFGRGEGSTFTVTP